MTPNLILASTSPFRRAMLENAGVRCATHSPGIDEGEIKSRLSGTEPVALAMALAEAKALAVSTAEPGNWVIGADQVLTLGGAIYDKPRDLAEARTHLRELSGREHRLVTAVCIARDGIVDWRYSDSASLRMRPLSEAFIIRYLDAVGVEGTRSVGAYQIEGLGAQLFDHVQGDYFTILGLPLLPVLARLREIGILET